MPKEEQVTGSATPPTNIRQDESRKYDEKLASVDSVESLTDTNDSSSESSIHRFTTSLEHDDIRDSQPPHSTDSTNPKMMSPVEHDAEEAMPRTALSQGNQEAIIHHQNTRQGQSLQQLTPQQLTPPRPRKLKLSRRHSARALTDQEKKEFEREGGSPRSPVHQNRSLARFIDEVKHHKKEKESDSKEFDSQGLRTPPRSNRKQRMARVPQPPETAPISTPTTTLTVEDIEVCQQLDDEFERALEEREIGYSARYNSVRQSAFLSVFFMLAYLVLGTAFFMRQADWSVADSLLFSIYTVTTVGYGNQPIPRTTGFQVYTIFYILVGIAALTIMVSSTRFQRKKWEMSKVQGAGIS